MATLYLFLKETASRVNVTALVQKKMKTLNYCVTKRAEVAAADRLSKDTIAISVKTDFITF